MLTVIFFILSLSATTMMVVDKMPKEVVLKNIRIMFIFTTLLGVVSYYGKDFPFHDLFFGMGVFACCFYAATLVYRIALHFREDEDYIS